MSQPLALDALRDSLRALAPKTPTLDSADSERLHRDVCAAVDALRQREVPVERAIAIVRELATDAGFGRYGDGTLLQLVAWCIDQYYARSNQPLAMPGE